MQKRITPVLLGQKGANKRHALKHLKSIFIHGAITVSDSDAKKLVRLVDRFVSRSSGRELVNGLRYLQDRTGSLVLAKRILAYGKMATTKRKSGFCTFAKVKYRQGDHTLVTKVELLDFIKKDTKVIPVKVMEPKAKEVKKVKKTK